MKLIDKFFPAIALGTVALFNPFDAAIAAPTVNLETPLISWEFIPPNDGAPDDRDDAGSRSACAATDPSFQALIPATNFGLTLDKFPTFWLYVPYPISSPHTIEFILRDETTKDEVYRTTFTIDRGEGIVSFRLPKDAPPLDKDRKYRWRFDLFCNGDAADFVSDNGVILRTAIEPEPPGTIADKLEFYAQNGIWHDLLTELLQQQCLNPNDAELSANLSNLLRHPVVRLDDFVSEPILEDCNASL